MISRIGIGGRLFAAFLGISALSLSSGVAGWLILREIAAAQSKVNADAMPAITAAQRAAEASARLVSTSPALTAAATEEARLFQERQLTLLTGEIEIALGKLRHVSSDEAALASINDTVGRLVANLRQQSLLVKERIALDGVYRERSETVIRSATSIVDLSETLVSNASSGASAVIASLYGLIDESAQREEAYDALDRLIEEDIYLLGRMFELRLRSSQVGLLTNRLNRAATPDEVAEIEQSFLDHLTVLRRRVRSIADPVRREQAGEFLQTIEQAAAKAAPAETMFTLQSRLLAIRAELVRLETADQELAASLNQIVQGMLLDTERFARNTAAQASRALDFGLYALLAATLGSIAVSGLIVWLYVERNLVRRLAGLTGAMRRLAGGDLDVTVAEDGTDELRAMAGAVRVFRDEGKRRRELEIERERINEELRRHREELQQLVGEQTAQLTETNARLQQEVSSHAEARERAEAASLAKSQFLATMSHEIRTPMTGMLGMTRILADSELNSDQRRHLQIIASSGQTLLGILNDILDYSKIESGKVTIEEVDFSLAGLLDGVAALMENAAREKGLDFELEIADGVWPQHRGDNGKLRQIVFNLLGNAIKFTEAGKVTVQVDAATTSDATQTVRIAISDTGIGIAPEHLETIFEAFAQTDASITRRFGGTGLGLAICKRLAAMIGARIEVRSEPGRGSTFTLTVPLAPSAQEARSELPALGRSKAPVTPLSILVVEDDAPTRLVVSEFLRQLGHSPSEAADGFSALEMFRQVKPELVLMDLSLPGMDGIEAARKLRQATPGRHLPIIAMSAHVFRTEIEHQLGAGMDAFVGKPLTPESLGHAIASVMNVGVSDSAPLREGNGAGDPALLVDVDEVMLRDDSVMLGSDGVRRLIDLARTTVPPRFVAMRAALAAGKRAEIGRLAHSIASAAGAAGFRRLLDNARALEDAADELPASDLISGIERCETAFTAAMSRCEAILAMPKADHAPPASSGIEANR